MSEGSLTTIQSWIKEAEPHNPLAIFRSENKGVLNAFFANTAKTTAMIRMKVPGYIGTYDNTMDVDTIEEELERNLKS